MLEFRRRCTMFKKQENGFNIYLLSLLATFFVVDCISSISYTAEKILSQQAN